MPESDREPSHWLSAPGLRAPSLSEAHSGCYAHSGTGSPSSTCLCSNTPKLPLFPTQLFLPWLLESTFSVINSNFTECLVHHFLSVTVSLTVNSKSLEAGTVTPSDCFSALKSTSPAPWPGLRLPPWHHFLPNPACNSISWVPSSNPLPTHSHTAYKSSGPFSNN